MVFLQAGEPDAVLKRESHVASLQSIFWSLRDKAHPTEGKRALFLATHEQCVFSHVFGKQRK